MLDNNTIIKVTNRGHGIVVYTVPDLGVRRSFESKETKDITMEELRKLSYISGGKYILEHCLIIDNADAVSELLGSVEPEYYYTSEEIITLLKTGSLDQLLDCLDYAPSGVIEDLKRIAVEIKLNDVEKRDAIFEKTGFNVSRAIDFEKELKVDTQEAEETKTRRAAPVSTKNETSTRRAAPAASKYKIVSEDK